ncbi:hypothetical protein ACCUM_1307 [Candidatus Accumulibacter phosphatis]|uniref:Uncharacterized protein n=1 Tax=Candidatus Accumulibacter phosphatis TaxID=327160 RepID=A0A5S4EJJ0_9PROT|nr:hypothetical protein ACCUM_1307 [Candidatus Accumulibacter phosphatis]
MRDSFSGIIAACSRFVLAILKKIGRLPGQQAISCYFMSIQSGKNV